MFRFTRELILPLFLERRITISELARRAGVAHRTAQRAVDGRPVTAPAADRVARALGVDPIKYLVAPAQ